MSGTIGLEDMKSSALLALESPGLDGVMNVLVGSYDNPNWGGPMGMRSTGAAGN